MTISHKIELITNNKTTIYFKKAFDCSRLAYRWGFSKWQEDYKAGIKKTYLNLKKINTVDKPINIFKKGVR